MSGMIKAEAEYDAALVRAWDLMDAEPGTPEIVELMGLVDLIEAYEDRTEVGE